MNRCSNSTLAQLILLSAIWGASFLFLRVAAPAFGPFPLILIRVSLAAACLAPVLFSTACRCELRRHLIPILVVGVFNSALPFLLLTFAALNLEAGFLALLNSATPFFAATVAWIWLSVPMRRSQWLGIAIGVFGVAVLSWDRLSFKSGGSGWAVLAALSATLSYGFAGNYVKRRLSGVNNKVIIVGSLMGATVFCLPLGVWFWPTYQPSGLEWFNALLLTVLCTAFAYLLYFNILEKANAFVAASVTFIVPLFAMLWGFAFLQEEITIRMLLGTIIILFGTMLCLGIPFVPKVRAAESSTES